MTTSQQPKKKKPIAVKSANKSTTRNNLPEGVTEEPRNEEEMHLKHIRYDPNLVDEYLAVSDDKGMLLGDIELEAEVISFIDEFRTKEIHEIEKPAVVLSKLRFLYKTYCARIDRAENITGGIVTKYGIRRGMLLRIEKKLLRKEGGQWVDHYTQTYGKKSLRSAQDYMALARIPNIIRY